MIKSNKYQQQNSNQFVNQFYEYDHEQKNVNNGYEERSMFENRPLQIRQQGKIISNQGNDDKQYMMNTQSTEIIDSKLRIQDDLTLRQIQQKNENEENSNQSFQALHHYAFKQKYSSPQQNNHETKLQNRKQKTCDMSDKRKINSEQRELSARSRKKNRNQIFVTLEYEHGKISKRYRVGMKWLNHQWFECLNNIHKNV